MCSCNEFGDANKRVSNFVEVVDEHQLFLGHVCVYVFTLRRALLATQFAWTQLQMHFFLPILQINYSLHNCILPFLLKKCLCLYCIWKVITHYDWFFFFFRLIYGHTEIMFNREAILRSHWPFLGFGFWNLHLGVE